MTMPEDLSVFARRFRALGTRRARLIATFYPSGNGPFPPGVTVAGALGQWTLKDSRVTFSHDAKTGEEQAFKQLARRAAVAIGRPDELEGWVHWLEALRLAKVLDGQVSWWNAAAKGRFRHRQDPGASNSIEVISFENLCQASEKYCDSLAPGKEAPVQQWNPSAENKGEDSRTGEPCSWNQVEITLLPDDRALLNVKGQRLGRKTFDQMGFAEKRTRPNGKRGRVPNAAWTVLQTVALKKEVEVSPRKRRSSSRKKRMVGQRDDAHDAHYKGDEQPDEPSSSGQISEVYGRLGGKPSAVRKQVLKIGVTLRKTLKGLGYDLPAESAAFTCVEGKYAPAFCVRYDLSERTIPTRF